MKTKTLTTICLLLFGTMALQAQKPFLDTNGKYGIKDKEGKIIVAGKYDEAEWEFSEGILPVAMNEKWGFIDEKGNTLTPFKYDNVWFDVFSAKAGFYRVNIGGVLDDDYGWSGGKWGVVDRSGKEIIPVKYEEILETALGGELIIVVENK